MLKDLVIRNRSVRGYDPSVKVSDEELMDMIDCARLSASSRNEQSLKFYIANDTESVAIINSLAKYGRKLPELHLPFEGTEPPAYIAILQDVSIQSSSAIVLRDVGLVAEVITLRAAEMGYGACMVGNYPPDILREKLGLSDGLEIRLLIAVGKSIEDIRIIEIDEGESTDYYRDENGVHYVPKRKLKDIIVNR